MDRDPTADEAVRRLASLGDPITLLDNLFAYSPIPIQVYQPDGRSLLVNDAFRALFGSEPPPGYCVFDDDVAARSGILDLIRRAFRGEPVRVPATWYDPRELRSVSVTEGRRVAIEANLVPVAAADGSVSIVLVLFHDRTDEMRAKEERDALLAEAQRARAEAERERARLYTLFDQAPANITVHAGPELRVELSNARHQALTGHRQLIGKPLAEAMPELRGQGVLEGLARVYETGEPFVAEELAAVVARGAGDTVQRFFDVVWQPVRSPDGAVEGVMTFSYDVTEKVLARKRAEELAEALRVSEERFRMVQERSPDGFMLFRSVRSGGRIVDFEWVYTNPAAERIVGRTHAELTNQRLLSLMPGNLAEGLFDAYVEVAETGVTFRRELSYGHEGLDRSFRLSAVRFGDGFAVTFEDVTDRKRAEEELRRSEARLAARVRELATLFDVVPVGLCVSDDPSCEVVRMNPAMARMLRQSVDLNISLSAPSDVRPKWRVFRGDSEIGGDDLPIQRAARGELVHDRFFVVLEDGTRIEFEAFAAPLTDPDGKPTGSVAAFVDITERTRVERALKEADARKDEFLATLAHELRNPLAPLRTGLTVLRMAKGDPQRAGRTLDIMERQLGHMVRLIDDLLDVSRVSTGKVVLRREPVTLAAIVDAALETSRPSIEGAKHELSVDVLERSVWIDGDLTRLAQVVSNILTNAAKYTPARGRISLVAGVEGDEAVVSVTDSGVGIPSDMLGKVFDMFTQVNRTLDRAQGGLGIGLAIVKRLVEMHGGSIEARSDGVGRGSTFTVRLPLIQPHVRDDAPRDEGRQETFQRRPLKVLVVDDNVDAAESLGMLVEITGDTVEVVHDGAQALERVETFRPDIVFLDIGMPGMNGLEVARRLCQAPQVERPTLVALTGWGTEADQRQTREEGFALHLTKPVDAERIHRVLHDIARQRLARTPS